MNKWMKTCSYKWSVKENEWNEKEKEEEHMLICFIRKKSRVSSMSI